MTSYQSSCEDSETWGTDGAGCRGHVWVGPGSTLHKLICVEVV